MKEKRKRRRKKLHFPFEVLTGRLEETECRFGDLDGRERRCNEMAILFSGLVLLSEKNKGMVMVLLFLVTSSSLLGAFHLLMLHCSQMIPQEESQ